MYVDQLSYFVPTPSLALLQLKLLFDEKNRHLPTGARLRVKAISSLSETINPRLVSPLFANVSDQRLREEGFRDSWLGRQSETSEGGLKGLNTLRLSINASVSRSVDARSSLMKPLNSPGYDTPQYLV